VEVLGEKQPSAKDNRRKEIAARYLSWKLKNKKRPEKLIEVFFLCQPKKEAETGKAIEVFFLCHWKGREGGSSNKRLRLKAMSLAPCTRALN
jgi:hypothetical protein